MSWYEQAAERLKDECKNVKGSKEAAMKSAVRDALLEFARQSEEFAQAIVQGGSFQDCMAAVAKGVGGSISDLEAYAPKVVTNADRIRAMSDEELAWRFSTVDKRRKFLEWLRQLAEEDQHG